MRHATLPRLPSPQRFPRLRAVTLRGFSGGWNILDDDMNSSYKFSRSLENMYVRPDGVIALRYGTALFSDLRSFLGVGEELVNAEYFSDSLVVVSTAGKLFRVLGDGSASVLATGLWNATEFVSFAVFNNKLILCNGSDKPLIVLDDFTVEYLQDEGTGSNLNVPICKYVLAISRYLLMAGDPLFPNRVHISAKDAPGTWFGDPPPNDATHIDVGSVLPSANIIRGLMGFRGKVIVMFAEGLIVGTLGVYDEAGSHTPSFEDGIEGFGSVSHRSGIAIGDDGLFVDLEGVPSIKRTVLSTSFKPERASALIDPQIKAALDGLSLDTLENYTFAVYNKTDSQYMLFIPNEARTQQKVYVYSYRPSLNQQAWSVYLGWNFAAAVRSRAGNVFFLNRDGRIWLYGNSERPYTTDFANLPTDPGVGINFDFELPWIDFGSRTTTKTSRYISFDTNGKSEFTCEMFIDNFLVDSVLSTEFSGGAQGEFGDEDQPYGGGRNTSNKKQYAWPCKFEIMKLWIHGIATEGLDVVSISMHCLDGGISR